MSHNSWARLNRVTDQFNLLGACDSRHISVGGMRFVSQIREACVIPATYQLGTCESGHTDQLGTWDSCYISVGDIGFMSQIIAARLVIVTYQLGACDSCHISVENRQFTSQISSELAIHVEPCHRPVGDSWCSQASCRSFCHAISR